MYPKFIQIATGNYSYEVIEFGVGKQKTGHCVYGLDTEGQIWKWAIREGKGQWAKFEDCKPENYD